MKIYYTIYKVTNKISGKFYVGSHKTRNLDDTYMGSGKYLKHSIEKHGLDNFQKEILFVYDNPEDMFAKEAEIVNEDFLAEENTYNLKVGGFGGWDYINGGTLRTSGHSAESFKKISNTLKSSWKNGVFDNVLILNRKRLKLRHKNGEHDYCTFKGKTHTEETKLKIGAANAEHQKGSKNSQFGTMWITNTIISKKILKTNPIPEGWCKGRK
jgi:hypothetical protein